MSDGTERNGLEAAVSGDAKNPAASGLRPRRALLGQARLPDARSAVDAEPLAARVPQCRGESIELVAPPHQRPASRDRHGRMVLVPYASSAR